MTAQYKLRTRVSENDRGIAHLTIRLEKHLFIDRNSMTLLTRVADGVEGVDEMLQATKGVLQALGPEAPPTAVLGMETDWLPVSETGAETIIDKYFQQEPSFGAAIQGGARNGKLLVTFGHASMSVPLSRDQARSDKEKLEQLATYCTENPPKTPDDVTRAVEAIAGVGAATGSIIAVGEACLIGGVLGGMVGVGVGCILGIAGALGTFLGFVDAMEKQQRSDREMRDREKVCGPLAGGPSAEMMDRVGRTC